MQQAGQAVSLELELREEHRNKEGEARPRRAVRPGQWD